MARLRVRSGADIHLADAFEADGCPLCRERRRTERSYLESILSESVNDVGFRQGLDAARGFCGRHAREVLDADRARSGTLGASILLRATLVARLRDIEAAAGARGWSRTRRMAEARRPPACPACERVATADGHSTETVVRLAEDGAWAEAVASAPFCLDHLLALLDRRAAPAWWPAIEVRQVERLRELGARLERFAHASAHDRRHLQTADQRASVDEAADLLAGPPPAGQRPGEVTPVPAGRSSERRAGASRPGSAEPASAAAGADGDAEALLITGVYGSGKSTLAIELADILERAGTPVAAIDLDWLGWFSAPVDWDEHEDPRMTVRHLDALSRSYLDAGVRRLVIAGSVPPRSLDAIREAVGVPLRIIRLRVDASVVRARLGRDPNASRADDLTHALGHLDADDDMAPVDAVIDGDAPVADVAAEALAAIGWATG